MKVQLLKMVHSLCDRNGDNRANKALFVLPQTLPEDPPSSPDGPTPAAKARSKSSGLGRRGLTSGDVTDVNEVFTSTDATGRTVVSESGAIDADVAGDDVGDDDVADDDTVERSRSWEDGASASEVRSSGEAWFPVGGVAGKSRTEGGSGTTARERVRGLFGKRTEGEASTSARGEEEGLMASIVRTLMKQTAASSFR